MINQRDTLKTYIITGMDCAGCAREVETGVAKLDGVKSVQVDFATSKMHLEGSVPFDILQARVSALGKNIQAETDRHVESVAVMRGVGSCNAWWGGRVLGLPAQAE